MMLTQYASVSPNVDATVKTINGKVNELLNIAQAYGVSAAEGMTGSGNITLDIHATGPHQEHRRHEVQRLGCFAECVAAARLRSRSR